MGLESNLSSRVDGPESGSFPVSLGFPPSDDGELVRGENTGLSIKGAAFGGAVAGPNNAGGVLGRECATAETGTAGDAERAFFVSRGERGGSSSSSPSSSPLIGRLARGELRVGRVDGLPTPSRPGVRLEAPAGGADAARLIAGADPRSPAAGEPGGVVLVARVKVGFDASPSFPGLVGLAGVKEILKMDEVFWVGGLAVGDSEGEGGPGGCSDPTVSSASSAPSSSSTSSSSSPSPSPSSSLGRSSSSDFRKSSRTSSPSLPSSRERKEVSPGPSSSPSASLSSPSLPIRKY